MKKILLTSFILLLLSSTVHAQNTNVSATVTDAGGQAWNNGTYTFNFVPAPRFNGSYQLNGSPYTPTSISGTLSSSASLTSIAVPNNALITPSGTQWSVTVCPQGSGSCFISLPITITGASQTITSSLIPPAIVVSCGSGVTAYADTEVQCGIGGQYYNLTTQATRICQASSGNTCSTWSSSSGGGGANSVGPVINPLTTPGLTGCPAAANADWATCFASASTAYNNASLIGTPTVRASTTAVCQPCTSFPITITSQPGDTALIWLGGPGLADTVSVSDNASTPNLYRVISPLASGSTTTWGLYGTVPRGVLNGATTITITDSTSRNLYAIVALISNYGAEKDLIPFTSASTSAPSILDASTLDANNMWLVGFNWFLTGQTVTAVANSGSVVQNAASNSTTLGLGFVSNAVASQFAASTDSLTLSQASTAQGIGVEVRSHSEVMPTLYLPPISPEYIYTGGLNLSYPGTLKGEPGSRLCYTGSGHEMEVGPTGMTANAFFRTYWVDGIEFACGSKMTSGIHANTYANFVGIRNSLFLNNGNSSACMIEGVSNNQDMEIGPQNKFIVDDGIPRNIFCNETANVVNASYARIHDNLIVCWNLQALVPTQCSTAQAGVGFNINGAQSRVYHNNLAFYNPDVLFRCNPGPCFGNEAAYNQIEPPTSGTTPGAPIQFQGTQSALTVHENIANMGSFSTVSLVGPNDGSSLLTGARVNFNTVVNVGAATPVVALNNLAGQTGNQSSNNLTSTTTATPSPAQASHTTGSNITSWNFNFDDNLIATGQAPALTGTGACATGNLSAQTGSAIGTVACGGTTGASTLIITPGFTATHSFVCVGGDVTSGHLLTAQQSGTSATTCTLSLTSVTLGDTVSFTVMAQ